MRSVASKWVVVSCAAAAIGLAACASIFGVNGGELLDGSTNDGDGGSGDAIADVPYDYVIHDAVDPDVNTAICEGGVSISDAAVWVSASGNNSTACGAQTSPCQTVQYALGALNGRTFVYLDNSTFTENVVVTQAGVTIQGGWLSDAGWTPQCDSKPTKIEGPDDGGSAAVAIKAANVTLRLLTVESKANGANGETVYAVRADDAPNTLIDNVSLIAESGGPGMIGTTPNGPVGCTPLAGSGAAGDAGAPSGAGGFNATDFFPAKASAGGGGSSGTLKLGQPGQCFLCSEQCL